MPSPRIQDALSAEFAEQSQANIYLHDRLELIERHVGIVDVRLAALKRAIVERNWHETEFQFDRVLRAVQSARALGDKAPE